LWDPKCRYVGSRPLSAEDEGTALLRDIGETPSDSNTWTINNTAVETSDATCTLLRLQETTSLAVGFGPIRSRCTYAL